MSDPKPPVGGIFRPDGLFLTLMEKKSIRQRLLTWDDLAKLARRGKKQTTTGALKDFTKKVDEVVKSNAQAIADSQKRAAESKARLEELKRLPQVRPVLPPLPRQAAP